MVCCNRKCDNPHDVFRLSQSGTPDHAPGGELGWFLNTSAVRCFKSFNCFSVCIDIHWYLIFYIRKYNVALLRLRTTPVDTIAYSSGMPKIALPLSLVADGSRENFQRCRLRYSGPLSQYNHRHGPQASNRSFQPLLFRQSSQGASSHNSSTSSTVSSLKHHHEFTKHQKNPESRTRRHRRSGTWPK
jgi:hypothetical protein